MTPSPPVLLLLDLDRFLTDDAELKSMRYLGKDIENGHPDALSPPFLFSAVGEDCGGSD